MVKKFISKKYLKKYFKKIFQKNISKKYFNIAPSKNVFKNCCKLNIGIKNTRCVNCSIFKY